VTRAARHGTVTVPHVISAQGWLLKPLSRTVRIVRTVGQFRLRRPYTPDVIKLRCLFKELSPFVILALQFPRVPLRPNELGDLEIIGASCLATGLPSFSLVISCCSRVRAQPICLVVSRELDIDVK
jgi:hypothetical protein